jgi:hypothetical protein
MKLKYQDGEEQAQSDRLAVAWQKNPRVAGL